MSSDNRGMAFIDFDNINITARNQHGIRYLNFNKLREILLKDLRCVGCIVYLPNKMSNLLPVIQKSGLEVKVVSPGKSIDGRLIFDLLTNAYSNGFDSAVIASGDRDYIPVVEEVKRKGKKVLIASFSSALAHGMTSVSDGVIDLDKFVTEISSQTNTYKCATCGAEFQLPFKLFAGQTPYCKKHKPKL
jgi:uncharacterized LabA/DUF88 family protein